jgi:TPR repeat protein
MINVDKIPRVVFKVGGYLLKILIVACEKGGLFPRFSKAMRASGAYGEGTRAYERGDYALAFQLLKPLADLESGPSSKSMDSALRFTVAAASYYVGLMYFYGNGVSQSFETGVHHFRKAADLEHPDAAQYLREIGRLEP